MKISDIGITRTTDHVRLQSSIHLKTHWVWGDKPFELWFSLPHELTPFINPRIGDAFIPAFLPIAMALGECLEIDSTVSPRLLQATDSIQTILKCWEPSFQKIRIRATPSTSTHLDGLKGSALFFSLGVDSSYSLVKNLGARSERDTVTHLLTVEGFDIYLWESQRFPPLLNRIRQVADHFGLQVVPITTNLRDLSDRVVNWVKVYHGPALAAVAHLLQPLFASVRIAAAQTFRSLIPRGAHPLLDPLWSTEEMAFLHDGLEATRFEKILALSQHPIILRNLRVCATGEVTDSYNCGRCEKCLRTMIALRLAGVLDDCETLPHSIDTKAVANLSVPNRNARTFLKELEEIAARSEVYGDLSNALRSCLSRSRGEEETE